jgi:hypothetical protein
LQQEAFHKPGQAAAAAAAAEWDEHQQVVAAWAAIHLSWILHQSMAGQ